MNNEKHKKFLELADYSEQLVDKLKEVDKELSALMKELGLDTYIQDPNTMLVYKIHKPKGVFILYKDVDYKRTAKEGEIGGTVLSKKEAEAAGFDLTKRESF